MSDPPAGERPGGHQPAPLPPGQAPDIRRRPLWDPGAQPERTYQGWTRTALSLTACALLATRLTAQSGAAAVAVTVFGVAAALSLVVVQKRRLRSAEVRAAPASVAALTALTVLLAAGALALVLDAS